MSKKTKAVVQLGVSAVLLVIGTVLGAVTYAQALGDQVDPMVPAVVSGCPTEDSCDVDYHDGAWHIVKVVS